MTRQEIEQEYKVDKHGIIQDLGKFESEMLYAPYFYNVSLDGGCEELSYMEDGVGEYAALIEVTGEDREQFPELDTDTAYILLTESDTGFVGVKELTNKQAIKIRDEYAMEVEDSEENSEV